MNQSLAELGELSKAWPFSGDAVDRAKRRQVRRNERAERKAVRAEGRELRRLNRRYYGPVGGRVANVTDAAVAPVGRQANDLINQTGRVANDTIRHAEAVAPRVARRAGRAAVKGAMPGATKLAGKASLYGALGIAGGITAGEAGRRAIRRIDEASPRYVHKSLAELGEVNKGMFSVDEDVAARMTDRQYQATRKRLRNSTLIGGLVGLPLLGPLGAGVGAGVGRAMSANNINNEFRRPARGKKVKKSDEEVSGTMNLSELGQIAKAASQDAEDRKMARQGYRPSHLRAMNPRSNTYVKRGSGVRRIVRPQAGGLAGGVAGGAIGSGIGAAVSRGNQRAALLGGQLGYSVGGMAGSSWGLNRNIKTKDTVSYNRRSGKKARNKVNLPYVGPFNVY